VCCFGNKKPPEARPRALYNSTTSEIILPGSPMKSHDSPIKLKLRFSHKLPLDDSRIDRVNNIIDCGLESRADAQDLTTIGFVSLKMRLPVP